MPDYQNNRFSRKPFRKGGFDRASGPKQMYKAECSNCHQSCEVPFRPNGTKPVFCSNCFKRDEGTIRPSFQKREYAPRIAPAQEDRRIDELKLQLSGVEAKLDTLIASVEASRKSKDIAAALKNVVPQKAAKKPAKKATKKK